MSDSFFSGPWSNLAEGGGFNNLTRKDNYAQTILAHSSLVSYWRLGDRAGVTQYSANIIADKPTAYWRLNDASGNGKDLIAANSGVAHGGITYGQSSPIADVSTSMTFDGTTGYMNTPLKLNIPSYTITFEAWVNHAAQAWSATHEMVLASNNSAVYMSINNGSVFLSVSTNNVQTTVVGPVVPTTNWNHVACTFDGTTLRTYLNGVAGATATAVYGPFPQGIGLINIATFDQAGNFFKGGLGELALYPYALTQAQIMNHYATGVGRYAMTVIGDKPLAYWRLGEPSGSVFASAMGGYSATISGTPTLGVAGAIAETDKAATFDTTGHYAEVLDANQLSFDQQNFSIECWWNPNENVNYKAIFGKGIDSAGAWGLSEWFLVSSPGNVPQLGIGSTTDGNSSNITFGGSAATQGSWNHLVGTIGTDIRLYINGTLVYVQTRTLPVTSLPAQKVRIAQDKSNFYSARGSLDEVAYYGYVLSAAQVANHYAAGLGKWADVKGGFHGTLAGPTTPTIGKGALPGDPTSSSKFDGSNALTTSLNLGAVSNYTLEAWVFRTSVTGTGNPRIFNWTSDGFDLGFLNSSSLLAFYAAGRTNGTWQAVGTVPLNQWVHCAVTYDGTTFLGYINGALKLTYTAQTGGALTASTALGINLIGESNQGFYQELAQYSATLTANQILQHYQVGSGSGSHPIDFDSAPRQEDPVGAAIKNIFAGRRR